MCLFLVAILQGLTESALAIKCLMAGQYEKKFHPGLLVCNMAYVRRRVVVLNTWQFSVLVWHSVRRSSIAISRTIDGRTDEASLVMRGQRNGGRKMADSSLPSFRQQF